MSSSAPQTVIEFMRAIEAKNTASQSIQDEILPGQITPASIALTARPGDAAVSDGKRQRSFYYQPQVYSQKTADRGMRAVIDQRRPVLSRDFDEEFSY